MRYCSSFCYFSHAHGPIIAWFILNHKMDSVYTQYTDQITDHVMFTINNSTDQNQRVYLQDLTAYGFKNNIDYVTNAFTWIEERDARSWYADGMNDGSIDRIFVLCCLRLEPNNYATVQAVIDAINAKLMSTVSVGGNTFRRLPCGLYAIQLMKEHETGEYKHIRFMLYPYDGVYSVNGSDATPTVRIAPAVLRDQLNVIVLPQNVPLPVNINANMPTCVTINESNMSLNEKEIDTYITASTAMRQSVRSLTRHAINFDKGITKKLGLNAVTIDNNALFYAANDAVRLYENGNDYTEFLLNNSMLDMLTLRSYFVNTKVFKGFDDNTEITDVTTGIDKNGTLWSLNVNSINPEAMNGIKRRDDADLYTLKPCDEQTNVTDLLEIQLIRPTAIKMNNIRLSPLIEEMEESRVKQILYMLPQFTFMANQVADSNSYNGKYVLRSDERFEFTFILPVCSVCDNGTRHNHKGNNIAYTVTFINNMDKIIDVTKYIESATILGVYDTDRLVSHAEADSYYAGTTRVLSAFPEVRNDVMINYLDVKSEIDEKYVSSYKYLLTGTLNGNVKDNIMTINNISGIPNEYMSETSGLQGLLDDTNDSAFNMTITNDMLQNIAISIDDINLYTSEFVVSDCYEQGIPRSTLIMEYTSSALYICLHNTCNSVMVTPGTCTMEYLLSKEPFYVKRNPLEKEEICCCLQKSEPSTIIMDSDYNLWCSCDLIIDTLTTATAEGFSGTADIVIPTKISIGNGTIQKDDMTMYAVSIDDSKCDITLDADGYTITGDLSNDTGSMRYNEVSIMINKTDATCTSNLQCINTFGSSTTTSNHGTKESSYDIALELPQQNDGVLLKRTTVTIKDVPVKLKYDNGYVLNIENNTYDILMKSETLNGALQSAFNILHGIYLNDGQIDDDFISNIISNITSKFRYITDVTIPSTYSLDLTSFLDTQEKNTDITANSITFPIDFTSALQNFPYLSYIGDLSNTYFTFQHRLVSWYYYRYLQNKQSTVIDRTITRSTPATTSTAAKTESIGGINYAQDINNTNTGLMNPLVSLPFFPYSDKLYVKLSGLSDIDSFIETNSDHETMRGKTLSIIQLSNVYTRVLDTYSVTNDNYTDSSGVVTETIVPTNISGSSTLTGNTNVQTITQPLNTIIDIPARESRTIYVTGNLHMYPIYKAPHRLTYEIL